MRAIALVALICGSMLAAGTPAAAAWADDTDRVPAPGLNCIERVAMPDIANVLDAKWSPDGTALAIVRFDRHPSSGPGGYVEDESLELLDVRTHATRSLGAVDYGRPAWSGSGRYLAYWGDKSDFLQVMDRWTGEIVAKLTPSMPHFHWAGDALLYVEKSTIRRWDGERTPATLARIGDSKVPHYPESDWGWSGDGTRFVLTRYDQKDPVPERFIGTTATADMEPLEVPGALFTEWAPSGSILLTRYPTKLDVRDLAAGTTASIPIPRGAIHSWGADGRTLFVGTPRASDAAGDAYEDVGIVWPAAAKATAIVPDLFGTRGFSPDGRYFSGTVRIDRHDNVLAVFRCYEIVRADRAVAPVPLPARMAKIDGGTARLIRPVAGSISQFMHPGHTGVDIAAPFASPVVAADAGVVTKTDWVASGGLYVCVQHGGGLETCYYHVGGFLVTAGQRVARGQPIALVGMTGDTIGPHVHWEAKLNGKLIDPLLR